MLNLIQSVFQCKIKRNIFFILLGILVFIFSKNFGFFHDDITFGSKVGNYLYNNSLLNWKIPKDFDSGHPPLFGFVLAFFWKMLGHKLWVSHLVILPFVIGFYYQLHKFISLYIENKKYHFFAFLLIIADPTVASSLVLVNMEIISMFLFFLTINSIKEEKHLNKYIGLFFLSILSLRYMMLFIGIFFFEILKNTFIERKKIKSVLNFKFFLQYFLCATPGIVYIVWRYLSLGYITNPNSPWSSYGNLVDFKYFIRNCMVLIWRYIDFGRVFIMLFLFFSLYKFRKKIRKIKQIKELLVVSIAPVFIIIITILMITNTVGLRYFIVSYICLNLLSFYFLTKFYSIKKILYFILLVGLFTGNLWVYPKTLSQAWHNTLGHVPYHSLRLKAIDYLNNQKINISEVASFFPNYTTLDFIDFTGDQRSFLEFTGKEKYVFYANVYNLTDEELKSLHNNYISLKEFNNFNINITIYILKEK